MQRLLNLYKPRCVTPLELIERFRTQYPDYRSAKLGYAGRLDPMAEGVLLVLVNEENKKRKEYERLSKAYECDVLFGLTTDTYDILGKIQKVYTGTFPSSLRQDVKASLQHFIGKQFQSYPPFSSVRVNGKSLYYWARLGKLDSLTVPKKQIEISSITLMDMYQLSRDDFMHTIEKDIPAVHGNFRQSAILSLWKKFFEDTTFDFFPCVRFSVFCSSGTYIRSLAYEMGEFLGYHALAIRIVRTGCGEFSQRDALKLIY